MGIPIVYLRSSSMNTWNSYCEMQYYLIYGLGYKDDPNVKAEMGTVAHKVLEILSLCKLALQEGRTSIQDDVVGNLSFTEKDFYKETIVPEKTIASINKHRSFKKDYKWDCLLKNNKRQGQDFIKSILNQVYDYYQSRSSNEWDTYAKYRIENWIWIPLEYNNGEYDVRKREIYMPEQRFNITIEEDWAKYDYDFNGEIKSGYLSVKGTIDLITKTKDYLEVVDWKSGQRKDWSTGKVKTYDKLLADLQLQLYYWAITEVIKQHAALTIFFIRDGGPTSLIFNDETIENIKVNIKRIFEEIKNCKTPKPRSKDRTDVQCSWCTFYKNKFDGDSMNICRRIEKDIEDKGIEQVTKERIQSGSFEYQNPGE